MDLSPTNTGITEMNAQMLVELKNRTVEGALVCKQALKAHPDDIENAIEPLRCQEQSVARRKGSMYPCGCVVR